MNRRLILLSIAGAALMPLVRRISAPVAPARDLAVLNYDPSDVERAAANLRQLSGCGESMSAIGGDVSRLGAQLARPLLGAARLTGQFEEEMHGVIAALTPLVDDLPETV